MSSALENKILNLQERLRAENESRDRDKQQVGEIVGSAVAASVQPSSTSSASASPVVRRPKQLGEMGTPTRPRRQLDLPVSQIVPPKTYDGEFESKLREIMKMNGILNIDGQRYHTEMKDLEHMGELGNGTCGHVVKMRHKPSGVVIAVKQMRRSGNAEENKRIIMDLDVVLKSHDCPYIVQCLGCFITESDVWICMELMVTCLDKLLKKSRQAIPEDFLGKVTVATVKALSYLKEKHGVIHRDVKPSNILLDETGGVKLCDFGISGRLVDSKAKTRSAGCAAYMAPERIDPPDPTKPDYDIRADVWSLGITLVELATGVFPYRDCKTDFEVLSRVVQDDPPALPPDAPFSREFRSFVNCCLTKNYKHRPKYHKLMEHPFIKKYDTVREDEANSLQNSDLQWFGTVMRQLEPRFAGEQQPNACYSSSKLSARFRNMSQQIPAFLRTAVTKESSSSQLSPFHQRSNSENVTNYVSCGSYGGGRRYSPPSNKDAKEIELRSQRLLSSYEQSLIDDNKEFLGNSHATNGRNGLDERPYSPFERQEFTWRDVANTSHVAPYRGRNDDGGGCKNRWQGTSRCSSPFSRDYSPWRRENVDPPGVIPPSCESGRYSPFLQQRLGQSSAMSQTHPQAHPQAQGLYASPMVSRKRFPSEPPRQGSHDTGSPELLVSRFAHQLRQDPPALLTSSQAASKELSKKRFASYVRLRLGGDRAPSPEPPPRLSRGESPIALRRSLVDAPSFSVSRRYCSASPPQPLPLPPPRRLSESSSVPGSPQHVRARLRYTPEPQRRPPLP